MYKQYLALNQQTNQSTPPPGSLRYKETPSQGQRIYLLDWNVQRYQRYEVNGGYLSYMLKVYKKHKANL